MHRTPGLAATLAASFVIGHGAAAQTAPDAGSLLRQIEQRQPAPLPARPTPRTPPPPLQAPGQATITVKAFNFEGNTLLPEAALRAALAGFVGRPLAFSELQDAAVAVANTYREAGWVVRAYLPQQDVSEGRVTVQVVEAVFGKVTVEGQPQRVPAQRLQRMVEAAQAPGEPLNGNALDRALLLIDDLPGVTASGRLAEGSEQAQTDLVLTAKDSALLGGEGSVDNAGSRSTGGARLTVNAALNSPLKWGDQALLTLLHTEGSDYVRAAYTLPLGQRGWRLGANLSQLNYKLVTPEFQAIEARGDSSAVGAELNLPVLRSRLRNLYLALAADSKHFHNLSGGATATDYRTQALTLGLSGNLFDEWLGGGANTANLALVRGRVDLGGSPNEAADAATTQTAGSFGKLRYTLARNQLLGDTYSAYVSLAGQLASKNLDSSERFYLGGASGVRAYPSNEAGGSEGWLFSAELRARLPRDLTLALFHDAGSVRVNRNNDIAGATTLNRYRLAGSGASLSWTAPFGLALKATLARRSGDNPNPTASGRDQDGSLQKNRFWLQASQPF